MTAPAVPLAPTSPVERTLVARGWSDVDVAERLGQVRAREARVAALGSDRDRARQWYRRPEAGHLTPGVAEAQESDANLVRYQRVTEVISSGERILEIGVGRGFLATLMLRDGGAASYRGVELDPVWVDQTTQMLAANGLTDRASVTQGDLYDLTRADVEASGASLLVCCEVVEHVPDPDRALATLGQALPEGVDLLFSVPLVGRLEGVWGHTQVFGAARLQGMLARAGLVAHHVEVVHDTWVLVLASGGTDPSPRAARLLESASAIEPQRLLEPPFAAMTNHPVTGLDRVATQHDKRVADLVVEPFGADPARREGLRVRARSLYTTRGPGHGWSSYAGVAFAVPPGTRGARLEVSLADPAGVGELRVEWRRAGERTGLWVWKPAEHPPRTSMPTFLIAPGRRGSVLRRVPGSSSEGADEVEVTVRAREEAPIDFRILRWAWVG